jgi:hypothetical protein
MTSAGSGPSDASSPLPVLRWRSEEDARLRKVQRVRHDLAEPAEEVSWWWYYLSCGHIFASRHRPRMPGWMTCPSLLSCQSSYKIVFIRPIILDMPKVTTVYVAQFLPASALTGEEWQDLCAREDPGQAFARLDDFRARVEEDQPPEGKPRGYQVVRRITAEDVVTDPRGQQAVKEGGS